MRKLSTYIAVVVSLVVVAFFATTNSAQAQSCPPLPTDGGYWLATEGPAPSYHSDPCVPVHMGNNTAVTVVENIGRVLLGGYYYTDLDHVEDGMWSAEAWVDGTQTWNSGELQTGNNERGYTPLATPVPADKVVVLNPSRDSHGMNFWVLNPTESADPTPESTTMPKTKEPPATATATPELTQTPEAWHPGAAQCEFFVGADAQTYEIVWLAGNGSIGGVSQSGSVDNGKVTIVFSNHGYYRLRSNNGLEVYFSMPGCVVPQPAPAPEDTSLINIATPVPARQDRIWQQGLVTAGTGGEITGLIEIPKLGDLQINLKITTTMALAVNNVVNQQIGYAACDGNICGLHTSAYPGVMQGLQKGDVVIKNDSRYAVEKIIEQVAYDNTENEIGDREALVMCDVKNSVFVGNKIFILEPIG